MIMKSSKIQIKNLAILIVGLCLSFSLSACGGGSSEEGGDALSGPITTFGQGQGNGFGPIVDNGSPTGFGDGNGFICPPSIGNKLKLEIVNVQNNHTTIDDYSIQYNPETPLPVYTGDTQGPPNANDPTRTRIIMDINLEATITSGYDFTLSFALLRDIENVLVGFSSADSRYFSLTPNPQPENGSTHIGSFIDSIGFFDWIPPASLFPDWNLQIVVAQICQAEFDDIRYNSNTVNFLVNPTANQVQPLVQGNNDNFVDTPQNETNPTDPVPILDQGNNEDIVDPPQPVPILDLGQGNNTFNPFQN